MGIITTRYKSNYIDLLLNDISTSSSNNYFLFIGNVQPWVDENVPPAVFSSINDAIFESQINTVFGKKLGANNVRYMFRKISWVANTIYTQFEHDNINLNKSPYYVITDENKVYKCLSNGNSNKSQVKPTLTQNTVFKTSDDYVWKYMFTVDVSDMKRFATPYHVPVNFNPAIIGSATSGIDHIQLVSGGSGYIATANGSVQTVVTPDCIQIDNYTSNVDDLYTDSSLYIHSGPDAGSLRTITRYISNTTGNYCYLDSPLNSVIPILSKYKITPAVKILGDGTGARAICDINDQMSIANVTIISSGNGYTRAVASISANTLWGTGANVHAIVSPRGGHGSDPVDELNATALGVYVDMANTSFGVYPNLKLHRYGIMKNPKKINSDTIVNNDFISTLSISLTPSIVFTAGDMLSGDMSGAQAYVVQSNSTVTVLSGDKSFIINETIRSLSSNTSSAIGNIISLGDIDEKSSEIMYINNTTKILNTSNNNSTYFKVVFDLFDNNVT